MLTQSLRGLAVAAVAVFILGPAPAAAVTLVSACQPLDKAGETYVLTADITASSDCFLIQADRITLDLAGKTITGSGGGGGVGFVGNFTLTVVKNGSIVNFLSAIFLPGPRNTVRNVTASDNGGFAILVGPNSLVKDCIVQRNGSGGILTGHGSQVEGCLIGGAEGDGNGGVGLVGGERMLVTRNTVIGNGAAGILVEMNSTVSHNTSNENGNGGMAVGQKSLVTLNTANDNDGDGMVVVCPSTITFNRVSGNDNFDIGQIGVGCVIHHNTTGDPQ